MLISTVGPFAKYGAVAVRAAIAAGADLPGLDGRARFIRRVFEQFDGPAAAKSGAALLTAQGFDWVPGALAGRAGAGGRRAGRGPRRRRLLRPRRVGQRRDQGVPGRRDARPRLRLPRRAHRHRARRRARARASSDAGTGASPPAAPSTSRCRPRIRGCARSTPTSAGRPARARRAGRRRRHRARPAACRARAR